MAEFRLTLAFSTFLMGWATSAYAQPIGDKEQGSTTQAQRDESVQDASKTGLEDIVVTATRREARLQDVPVSVTALTSKSLASADVSTLRTLTQVVPGFVGSRNMGVFQPVMRGVGSTGISVGDESNIATYIDGVYQPDALANWIDLVEVEQIEVLRGPQGTTFGRNATGGLINIITPDPSFDFRGRIAGRYGRMQNDANDYDARAYVTGGLSETVAADLSGLFRKTEGYIKDLIRGGTLGDQRVLDVRSKLLFAPNSSTKFVLTGEYFDQDSSINAPQPLDGNTRGALFSEVILPTGPWQASLTDVPYLNLHRWNVALRSQFRFDGFNLDTTTGYTNMRWHQNTDSDASNILLAANDVYFRSESISQEIKLASSGKGRLQWLLGGYFFQSGGSSVTKIINSPNGVTSTLLLLTPEVSTRSFAGFAEATYEPVDSLFITVGGRYTTERRTFRQTSNGVVLFDGTQKTFNKFNYRAAVRYNITDRTNIYVNYGTAYKSGVYNVLGTLPTPVDPENIKAWEGGIKSDPLSWLRTNLSTYHYTYENLQVQARSGASYILQNAANAKIYGGELEVTIAPSSDINLRGAASYVHARYTSFPNAQSFFPALGGGNIVSAQSAAGKVMTRAPEWTFNIGVDIGHDFDSGRLGGSVNLYHSSTLYYDFQNVFKQKAYELVNASLNWTTSDKNWIFSISATNLFNAKVFQTLRVSAFGTDGFYEQPRKIGLSIERKF